MIKKIIGQIEHREKKVAMDVNMKLYAFTWSIAKQNEVQLKKSSANPQSVDSIAILDWMRATALWLNVVWSVKYVVWLQAMHSIRNEHNFIKKFFNQSFIGMDHLSIMVWRINIQTES